MSQDAVDNSVPVALVVSPRAAAQGGASSPRGLLEQVGLRVGEQLSVQDLAGDRSAGKRWRQNGYRAIIAAGGDGTIGTTVTHLAGTGIPLGILPMGTSNDVARALGIPLDPAGAAAVIAGGVPTAVDLGLVREMHADTWPDRVSAWRGLVGKRLPRRVLGLWGRDAVNSLYFLHAATLGLNVEFAQLATDASRRAALGSLTYPASSLEALAHLRYIAVTVRLTGVPARDPATGQQLEGIKSESQLTLTTEVLQLAVVNTPLFGGALNLSLPGVDAHDHLLDVLLVEPPRLDKGLDTVRSVMDGLRAPRGLLRRRRQNEPMHQEREDHMLTDLAGDALFPGIRRYQARAISIETAAPVRLTLDGEVCAQTPVKIQVESAALAVLLPLAETDVPVGSTRTSSLHSPTEMPSL